MRHHAAQLASTKAWSADDFAAPLDGLDDELVVRGVYAEAVNLGREAFPGTHRDESDPAIDVWVGHVRQYAGDVPGRLAAELADAANEQEAEEGSTVQDVLLRIDRKLEALRSSVTRYAEPPWGAGWNGYGGQLQQRNILMIWVLDDDAAHCDDCPAIADGGPYAELPTWPGMGDTQCRDRCKCHVQADQESWDDAMGEAA